MSVRRLGRIVFEVIGWCLLATVAYLAVLGMSLVVYFSCGGDMPAPGSSGTENLDTGCSDRWLVLVLMPYGIVGGAILTRLWSAVRGRHRNPEWQPDVVDPEPNAGVEP